MPLDVLVVDDDAEKAEGVARGLSQVSGIGSLVTVGDQISAKKALRDTAFDLVVLDIALPLRANEEPQKLGGLNLLDEVVRRQEYKRPRHFVGLTAYADVYEQAAARFGNELWSIVLYDRTSDAWLEQLQSKARHIIAAESIRNGGETNFARDLCIITALQEPELDAILGLSWGWSQLAVSADATMYYEGALSTSIRRARKCCGSAGFGHGNACCGRARNENDNTI